MTRERAAVRDLRATDGRQVAQVQTAAEAAVARSRSWRPGTAPSRCRRSSRRSRASRPRLRPARRTAAPAGSCARRCRRTAWPGEWRWRRSRARRRPAGPTITVTELASAFVDTHSAGPAAVSMRTSRIAAEAEAGNAASAIASAASRGGRRRILSTYDMAQCVPARTIRPMQRAVAIALAGGLLAASAGAFALAQLLKLERSPIEAIRVDPTPNHGRGLLDRHDSALFSPRCAAPCLRSAQVRFRVHTSGPVTAEIVAPGGTGGARSRPSAAPGWARGRRTGTAAARAGSGPGRLLSVAGRVCRGGTSSCSIRSCSTRRCGIAGHERLAPRDLARLRHATAIASRSSCAGASSSPACGCRCCKARASCALCASRAALAHSRSAGHPTCRQALRDGARRPVPPARDRARRAGNTRAIDVGRRACTRGRPLATRTRRSSPAGGCAVGISADARGLRLDLARLGRNVRGTRAAVPTRPRPSRACRRRRAVGSTSSAIVTPGARRRALLAVRGARPAHVALRRPGAASHDPRHLSAAPRCAGNPLRRAHAA